jgi:hypothetical protein
LSTTTRSPRRDVGDGDGHRHRSQRHPEDCASAEALIDQLTSVVERIEARGPEARAALTAFRERRA